MNVRVSPVAAGLQTGRPFITPLFLVIGLIAGVPAQEQRLFEFRSAFWVNLHHYLHALVRSGTPLVEALPAASTADEQQRWRAALDSYRTRYGKESLLFNEGLVRLKLGLASANNAASLAGTDVPEADRAVLESAAPVYRRHHWAAHDRANQMFIASVTPLLKAHGDGIARRLAASYGTTWPTTPIRADVVHDAGPPGNAYTTNDPTHITIAAADPRHQGLATLELVFHEASHGWDMVLMKGVDEAAAKIGVRPPRNLWHELLFFNAGAITGDALAASGITGYQMYAFEQRVFGAPGGSWPAITKHWPEFLAGRISRDEAILRILAPR